jgi:hypothetical protein|tara:strand:- start:2592 stop:3257 length:666 start_codon:yes stop_codon:yes gene_type:complete
MARLFITPRELNFINDIAKEVIKDVIGQKIYLFQISEIKSKVHDIYEESPDKVFETPIELDCMVKYSGQQVKTDRFGSEKYFEIEAYVQSRDLLDKGIEILEGDFISYGSVFYEITKAPSSQIIFGQIEHERFITISGRQSRKDLFLSKIFGPTSESYTDEDAVQDTFVQQRGFAENRLGPTADVRDLRKTGVLDSPITGPKEVSSRGDTTKVGSSFYDEE